MTTDIAMTLSILAVVVFLFVHGRLRMDLVALLTLAALTLTGLVGYRDALSGFSNPAVVTVWAVFILSAGLSKTGVAGLLGRQILKMAGRNPLRLMLVIMLTSAFLSAFMNNVGVAALLLPVVMDIARQTDTPPSKLLMPLAYSSLLGGLTTMIGTPPNILVSDALRGFELTPFGLFDYTPLGSIILVCGIILLAVLGQRILPSRDMSREAAGAQQQDFRKLYDLEERLFMARLPEDSPLAGKSLAESRLGSSLGLHVIAIIRNRETLPAIDPGVVLQAGDQLLTQGNANRIRRLQKKAHFELTETALDLETLASSAVELVDLSVLPSSKLAGQTLRQLDFRNRFGMTVLAVSPKDGAAPTDLGNYTLKPGDTLAVQGPKARVDEIRASKDFMVSGGEGAHFYRLKEHLLAARIPVDSILVGKTLAESRFRDAYGFTVLEILREGQPLAAPGPGERIQGGDTLLIQGNPETFATLQGLKTLKLETRAPEDLADIEAQGAGLIEVALSPRSKLIGKSLRDLHFRQKFGVSVLAVWREGRSIRQSLRDIVLRHGDALLLYGPRRQFNWLADEGDFLTLTQADETADAADVKKAPLAGLIMGGVVLTALMGWLHISIAAVIGATFMVLFKCLSMEDAYKNIDWKSVFLIACMLPLGVAMERTGTAAWLAEGVVSVASGYGPYAVAAGLYLLTSLATQIIPTAALVVLMCPIAYNTANSLGISPYTLMMTVAMSASSSFMSPVSHPANVLVMGPGGYRFTDYTKLGFPLTLLIFILVMIFTPIFWPFDAV